MTATSTRPAAPRRPARRADDLLPHVHLAGQHSPRALRELVAAGRWVRVRRGAYVDADYLTCADADAGAAAAHAAARRAAIARVAAVVALAAAEAGAGEVVLSHESAALVWGLPLWRLPERVHLVVRSRRSVRAAPDVVGHLMAVDAAQVRRRGGVLVTSLERTVLDLACHRTAADALVVADAALRRGVPREALTELARARGSGRGIARAREVLALGDGLAESPWESFTRLHAIAAGLPAPRLQLAVRTRLGDFRADMGWDEWRALVEFDGLVKYTALAHGDPGRVVFEEKRRHDAIREVGWQVLRLTSHDFRDVTALHGRLTGLAPAAVRRRLVPRPHLLLRSARS